MTRRTLRNALRGLGKVLEQHSGCVDEHGHIRDNEEWSEAATKLLGLDASQLDPSLDDAPTIDEYVDRLCQWHQRTVFATWEDDQ